MHIETGINILRTDLNGKLDAILVEMRKSHKMVEKAVEKMEGKKRKGRRDESGGNISL